MLYRRNCNTLLSSSLRRCYINAVCFAFQWAALCGEKKTLCFFFCVCFFRPWELHSTCIQSRRREGTLSLADLICDLRWKTIIDGWSESPQDLICRQYLLFPVPCQDDRAAAPPLPQPGSQYMLSPINQTQSIDSYLARQQPMDLDWTHAGFLEKPINNFLEKFILVKQFDMSLRRDHHLLTLSVCLTVCLLVCLSPRKPHNGSPLLPH